LLALISSQRYNNHEVLSLKHIPKLTMDPGIVRIISPGAMVKYLIRDEDNVPMFFIIIPYKNNRD